MTIIEERDSSRYEESLRKFPASPFIAPAWLESFRTSRRQPIYFRFVSGGTTVGGIAGLILEPSSALLRKINRPIFFFSGPVGHQPDQEFIPACIQSLIQHATLNGYTSVQFNSWDYPYVCNMGNGHFCMETREEFIVNLRREFTDIRKAMRRMVKSKVKKAEECGLTFHESDAPDLIAELVSLLEETRAIRRAKGYEDYSYYYISYLDKEVILQLMLNKIARIFYVKENETILCAQLTAAYGQRAYGLVMGSKDRGYELGANALLWYRIIERFQQEGYATLNLGGVANDGGTSGLTFFKTSLGAEPCACMGGSTVYLQGVLRNLIRQLYYRKLSFKTINGFLTRG